MHSALKLKMKPTAQRYAGGGLTSLMKKAATERKKPVPKYAEVGNVTYTSNVPEEAIPAYKDLIAQAGQLTDTSVDPATGQPRVPYQQYQGARTATSTPLQDQSYAGIGGMQTNANSQNAAGLAGLYAGQAGNLSYNPNSFSTYGSGPQQVSAGAGPQQVSGPGGPQQVGTQSFTQPGTAGAYMNPYMQSVVDTQKREAVRSDDVARTSRNAQAVGAGAFGGSRQAIQEAEANRNLQTRLGDIQTTGSNAAYQQAQQQFNTEQGLGLQGQQANQQAGLATTQMGQQAALANQSAGLQYGQQNLAAQTANQNAGLQFGNQYLDTQRLGEASNQFGATYGLQGLQTGIQGATAQGNLGQNLFNQQSDIYGLQNTAGSQQQQLAQQGLDKKYDEFQNQKNYPYQQLGFMSDILHGTQGTTSSVYSQTPQASNLQNIIGLSTGLAGIAGKAKGGAIEGGLAAIAPTSAGDFADGGIVGYAAGSDDNGIISGGVDRYGVPYDPESDMYEGADSTNPAAGWVSGKQIVKGGKAGLAKIKDMQETRDALHARRMLEAPSEVQQVYQTARDAKAAKAAAAIEAQAAKVAAAAAEAPSLLGGAAKTVGRVAGKAAPFLAPVIAGYETYKMTPEQRERQLWMEPDPNRSDFKKAATAVGSGIYNLGNDLTFGLADRFRDRKPEHGAPAAAVTTGIEQLDPVEKKKAEEAAYGLDALARLRAGSMASAGPAPTVAGVRQQQQEARGNGLEKFQQDMEAQGKQVEDAKRTAAEKYRKGLEDMFATQGIVGEHRRSTIEKQQAGLPQEETDMKNNALLRAGLSILAAPPGGGAFAAIARGALPALEAYGVDKDKFMARKNALDESMNKLLDAQQLERGQRGELRLKAKAATDAIEVEAKQRMYDLVGMVSKQKNITDPEALFKSFSDQFKDWRTSNTHVGVANAGMNARLGIAGLSLFGGGAGGGKPMSQAQFDTAVKNEVKLLQGQAGGARATPQALEAQARSIVLQRMKRDAGATPAPAGLRLLSVEPD